MNDTYAISIENLSKIYPASKKFPKKMALDELNLKVERGIIFGLLGPNGAGKSTLINILAGVVNKTSGKVEVMGHDLDLAAQMIKYQIGVVPQEIVIDSFFSLWQLLEFTAGYYGIRPDMRKTDEILKVLGLYDKRNNFPRQLSGGMRRRFLVAKAMVHSPSLLILDEPTAGVDIELREQLWNYVKKLNKAGTTIIITTHYLEEAQELCDQIGFISKGKIIKQDSTDNLLSAASSKFIEVEFASHLSQDIMKILQENKFDISGNKAKFLIVNNDIDYNNFITLISKLKLQIKDLKIIQQDLEDVFKELIGIDNRHPV
jgi:ABC-2 type transport system ATP-binding protein